MKILANENLPGAAVEALRTRGHDVKWVRTEAPGSRDEEVLAQAKAEGRLLVTFDKDFGELVFRAGFSSPGGIVLFRLVPTSPTHIAQMAVGILESRNDWAGHFTVVDEQRVRMVPLP